MNFVFVLLKSYSISPARLQRIMKKKLCSCVFLRFLLTTYFINLSLEKEIIVLEKVWQKS